MDSSIYNELSSHVKAIEQTVTLSEKIILELVKVICDCFSRGNKILLIGNGGSAADAQHIAAEFINRFRLERNALPAIALTTDSSILTCIGNDSCFDNIYSRQLEALAIKGDVLVAISTSGRSANVLKAVEAAHLKGVITIGFTGENGRESMGNICDYCLIVPSADIARIQECHEFIWHVICGIVEQSLFTS
jgi:D-sedoheptulose 7-phosphate isomerase